MLVVRMTQGERVMIGNTTVFIAGVGDSAVRLAIKADESLPIVKEHAISDKSEKLPPT